MALDTFAADWDLPDDDAPMSEEDKFWDALNAAPADDYNRRMAVLAIKQGKSFAEALRVFRGEPAVTTCDAEEQVVRAHLRAVQRTYMRRVYRKGTPIHTPWIEAISGLDELAKVAGPRPSPIHTFGALDESLGLVPGNVGWRTPVEKRIAAGMMFVEYEGEKLSITKLAERTGIPAHRIRARIAAGYTGSDLWTGKHLSSKYDAITINGQECRICDVARLHGINENTLRSRIAAGVKGTALLTPPRASKRATKGSERTAEYIEELKRDKELRKAHELAAKYGFKVTPVTTCDEE